MSNESAPHRVLSLTPVTREHGGDVILDSDDDVNLVADGSVVIELDDAGGGSQTLTDESSEYKLCATRFDPGAAFPGPDYVVFTLPP